MKKFKYINKEIEIFERLVQTFGGEVIPATPDEINTLESLLPSSYSLPAAYKEFLLYGGKKMGSLFEGGFDFSLNAVTFHLKNRKEIFEIIHEDDSNEELPTDLFVLVEHGGGYVEYFLQREGDNPPVYSYSEADGDGLEVSKKIHNSFSDFLLEQIRIHGMHLLKRKNWLKLSARQPPRGQQFWLPKIIEESEGIGEKDLVFKLGLGNFQTLEEAASLSRLDPYSYLEELSGWKAHKIDDEVRFFPPSYESPEEKEKKLLEQKNKLEEKKQELAKVEKKIANFQKRIKNLSGSTLSGIRFDNPSVAKIKELEKDLRKQRAVKQNLEREITKLEEEIN